MPLQSFEFLLADNVDKCRRRIPLIRAPVCGSDGKNYSNVHLLKRVSLSVKLYEGCPLGCPTKTCFSKKKWLNPLHKYLGAALKESKRIFDFDKF